jgi:DNA-binding MarR family transcriptional regulator/GNAT superfamily N-acetyltransferase
MEPEAVEQVRVFNRAVSERTGVLSDSFLGRRRPMGESRTLWEIGPDGAEVRELRARLGLDSGYMSRVLRSLEGQGLIRVEASAEDGRVRKVQLTDAGLAERRELDRRADEVAWSFLKPLGDQQRTKLLTAMADVERLLRASMVSLAIEDPATPGARWCMEQYYSELKVRFEAGFDPAQSMTASEHELVPPAGALMIARLRGDAIGCGAVRFHCNEPAELKRMWVAPEARGLGLGRRLMKELERHAQKEGARVIRLETNRALKEAIQLYRSSGYRDIAAFNDELYATHWFEKQLS